LETPGLFIKGKTDFCNFLMKGWGTQKVRVDSAAKGGYLEASMNPIFLYMLLSVVVVSLISLIGISLLALSHKAFHDIVFTLVALAVGALFGDCFFHLLPEAYADKAGVLPASLFVMVGILLFLVLENFLQWRHQHSDEVKEIQPVGYLNLAADMAHNFIDGLIIGASYLAGVKLGVATTLAVMLHEIPHEFSNFGILVKSGFSRGRALFLNFLTALTAVAGGLLAWQVGSGTEGFIRVLIPLTAGSFIYIAGSDLVPQLHKELNFRRAVWQFSAILAGLGIMLLLKVAE
jgi:zinc and cadmium transporter